MRTRNIAFLAAVAVGAALPLRAVDGMVLATSGASPTFNVYSAYGATDTTATVSEIADLPSVFSKMGDTVTATAPNGQVTTLSSASLSSVLNAGGVWTIASSSQGTARIGVAWTVYDDGGTLASGGTASGYGVDSVQAGPDRRLPLRNVLPVAYSGDGWLGDASAASTLAFVSPANVETELDFSGTGAMAFDFGEIGAWTVRLKKDGALLREAQVLVTGGFTLFVL